MTKMPPYTRISDLPGIGPAMADDYHRLGIDTVAAVAAADAVLLYERIQELDGPTDPCVLYTLCCAQYAARTPEPDEALLKWWAWKDPALRARYP